MQTFRFWEVSRFQKVYIYGIFFQYLYFYIHYQIVYLYFSEFQLVSTNCFSMNLQNGSLEYFKQTPST